MTGRPVPWNRLRSWIGKTDSGTRGWSNRSLGGLRYLRDPPGARQGNRAVFHARVAALPGSVLVPVLAVLDASGGSGRSRGGTQSESSGVVAGGRHAPVSPGRLLPAPATKSGPYRTSGYAPILPRGYITRRPFGFAGHIV